MYKLDLPARVPRAVLWLGTLLLIVAFASNRVHAQNPNLIDLTVGDTLTFAVVDNALPEPNRWEDVIRVGGTLVIPSTGHWYWELENYSTLGPEINMLFLRSTPTEVYNYRGLDYETLSFQVAPVGTIWFQDYPDGRIIQAEIEAVESVTVPAGTFTDCIRTRNRCLNCPQPNPEWVDWIKPGFAIVKLVDYWVRENPPVVSELSEFTPGGIVPDDDDDWDGIPNYRDSCPDTPPGSGVDPYGCPMCQEGAGAVPNGAGVPGVPLTLNKAAGDDVTLSWGASCNPTDSDYAVYEGSLGAFTSHAPIGTPLCTTGGATTVTVTPGGGSRYYLVVPQAEVREGSYGTDSNDMLRSQGVSACQPQLVVFCL